MAYISVPVEVDPATLTAEKIALLQERIPGLIVELGHPVYFLLEASSLQDAENLQLFTEQTDALYVDYGTKVLRVPFLAATQATGTVTITATDTDGHEIPAGLELTLVRPDGEREGFVVRVGAEIPNGQDTIAGVEIIAVNPGAQATGLSADAQPEEQLDWLDTITVDAPTVGGQDAETEEQYRDKLAERTQLMGDTLTLPDDYARDARTNVFGVARAMALDLYQAAKNETEELSHTATGGTFTLTVGANTTAALAWNATAAQIKTALELLASVGAGNTLVTEGPLPALVRIEFVNARAATPLAVSGSGVSLTGGGGAASFSLVVVQDGAAGVPNTGGTISVAVVNEDGLDPGEAVRDTGQARQEELTESDQIVSWITATYTPITVVFAAICDPDFDPVDVEARAEQAVLDFLSPARWGLPQRGDQPLWLNVPVVRFQDISKVVNDVDGLDHWTTLTVNGGTADVNLPGAAPMPSPPPATTASGTVTLP
jgi:hypothetical protein